LGFDGTFMKGAFPGQILTVVGLDSNNGIYPLAYAVVEAETFQSWTWFLELLGEDLNLGPRSNFTFISDKRYNNCVIIRLQYISNILTGYYDEYRVYYLHFQRLFQMQNIDIVSGTFRKI
jgi:hypothetical protein